jgi:hypothetical protein
MGSPSGSKWAGIAFLIGLVVMMLVSLVIAKGRLHPTSGLQLLTLLLAVSAMLLGRWVTGYWRGILIDGRNRLSLSKLQAVAWTILVLAAYGTAVLANLRGNRAMAFDVSVPQELWLAMGISIVSLVGSPLIKSKKKEAGAPREAEQRHAIWALTGRQVSAGARAEGVLVTLGSPSAASWTDLFEGEEVGNAGLVELGKFQMFMFTVLLIGGYGLMLATTFSTVSGSIMALPALSGGGVALLGISHAGYLADKSAPHTAVGETKRSSTTVLAKGDVD